MQKPIKIGLAILSAVVVILIITLVVAKFQQKTAPAAAPMPLVIQPPTDMPASQPPIDTTSTDDISSWKTYRNDEYGFEFKYPREFEIQTENFTEGAPGGVIFAVGVGKNILVNVARIEKDLRNWKDHLCAPSGMEPVSSSDMEIVGLKGRTYNDGEVYVVSRNNYQYFLSAFNVNKSVKEILSKILSTFKFIQ
jgi:hypothetical protein